ncbi:MAG: hypothetical protein ACF8Q5_06005 [Phycisphaerales bacterium JB040]
MFRHHTPILAMLALLLCVVPANAQVSPDDLAEGARERTRDRVQVAEEDLWTRSLVRRFENRVEETADLFATLERRNASLDEWMESLLTNEDGKRLAQNPNVAIQFLAYQEQPVLRQADFDAKRGFLDELQQFLQNAQDSPEVGYVPDPARVDEADDAYLWARDRLARIAEVEAWLRDALANVELDADVSEDPTLQQRIESYLARRHQLWLNETVAGKQAAEAEAAPKIRENARIVELERALFEAERLRREATQQLEKERIDFERRMRLREVALQEQLAAAEREYLERLAAIERQDRLAAAERGRRDTEAEIEAGQIDEDAERMRLVAKCRSARVQRDLKPFLDLGYWQPGDDKTTTRFEETPMSYSAIVQFGALQEDAMGLQMLLGIANANGMARANAKLPGIGTGQGHPDKERTKWGYIATWERLSREQIAEVRRIQQLLIELGPTLVEEGMLAP